MMMLALLLGSADPVAAAVATMTPEQKAAQLQSTAPADAAAGLPAYDWWNEGLHGLARNGPATVFPQAIGLAATWDVALMQHLHDQHGEALWRFCRRLVPHDRGRAEDVVQETLLRAWQHRTILEGSEAAVRAWLFTVARRRVIEHRHRGIRRRTDVVDPDVVRRELLRLSDKVGTRLRAAGVSPSSTM